MPAPQIGAELAIADIGVAGSQQDDFVRQSFRRIQGGRGGRYFRAGRRAVIDYNGGFRHSA